MSNHPYRPGLLKQVTGHSESNVTTQEILGHVGHAGELVIRNAALQRHQGENLEVEQPSHSTDHLELPYENTHKRYHQLFMCTK
jgi:hypothetical protein